MSAGGGGGGRSSNADVNCSKMITTSSCFVELTMEVIFLPSDLPTKFYLYVCV